MKKEKKRYRCVGNDGQQYTVIEYQAVIRNPLIDRATETVEGTKEWKLSNGGYVNFVDDQTFQIVSTDEFIRKVD